MMLEIAGGGGFRSRGRRHRYCRARGGSPTSTTPISTGHSAMSVPLFLERDVHLRSLLSSANSRDLPKAWRDLGDAMVEIQPSDLPLMWKTIKQTALSALILKYMMKADISSDPDVRVDWHLEFNQSQLTQGVCIADQARCLFYVWKTALHALNPQKIPPSDLQYLITLAAETAKAFGFWWSRHRGSVRSWRERNVFDARTEYPVLITIPWENAKRSIKEEQVPNTSSQLSVPRPPEYAECLTAFVAYRPYSQPCHRSRRQL